MLPCCPRPRERLPDSRQAHALDARVYALVAEFAGSVSAEHGIGTHKKRYLKNARSDVAITLMQSLKHTLDPQNILNPGKVFDMNTPSTPH